MKTSPTPPKTEAITATPAATEAAPPRAALVEALLDAALQAWRAGRFGELVRERPRLVRWLLRRQGSLVRGAAGDALEGPAVEEVAALLLQWMIVGLRPDAEPHLDGIAPEAWLHLPAWRPLLAVASTCGLLPIPDFPRAYRRRAGEAPLDNLCGLWAVGPSTVYRVLERARRLMAARLLDTEPDGRRDLALREHTLRLLAGRLAFGSDAERRAWHTRQAARAQERRDASGALWHACQAGDAALFVELLRRFALPLAPVAEVDILVARVGAQPLAVRTHVDYWLARAALERGRNAAERELAAYESARRVAQEAGERLLLGLVHCALGRYYDSRDPDHALACYQDSADFLGELGPEHGDTEALGYFVTTYVRLAWLYLRRNDARARAVLDRAEALRAGREVPDPALGMLEHTLGEYWHRAGDRVKSLEHRYRALNIFERLGDERAVLAAYVSIAHDLAARGDRQRAAGFLRRTLAVVQRGGVEPEIATSAHVNLGVILCDDGDLEGAIHHGRAALERALNFGLRYHAFRARYNLAEAHYKRFREAGDPEDERSGDAYVRDGLAAPPSDGGAGTVGLMEKLKQEVLGAGAAGGVNRLLPGEDAVHYEQMALVHRERAVLALPAHPRTHAAAHLAIARAYTAIAVAEREAALALVDRHGLRAEFVAELDGLRRTFERELTREQQLAAAWKQQAADLADDARRTALIAHLLRDGAVNKSGYGEICGVAPATASKHLGLLAERGLLVQRGKGPSTRYELP